MKQKEQAIAEGKQKAEEYISLLRKNSSNNNDIISALTVMKQYAATIRSDNRQSCREEYDEAMPTKLSKLSDKFRLYIGGKLEELPQESCSGFLKKICDSLQGEINNRLGSDQGRGV